MRSIQPTVRFLFSHPAHWIALGGGSGLPARAPGTWGTACGWVVFDLIRQLAGATMAPGIESALGPTLGTASAPAGLAAGLPWPWLAVCCATFVIGAWAAGRTGADLGVPDSGHIVIDEIVAFWLVLAWLPWLPFPAPLRLAGGLPAQALAFVVFRFFDIVKPPPIGYLDARLKNGWGVMVDDLVAAGFSLIVLVAGALAARWLLPGG